MVKVYIKAANYMCAVQILPGLFNLAVTLYSVVKNESNVPVNDF